MDLIRISAITGVIAIGALRFLPACDSLSDTTPVPGPDISDLDAGHPPPPPDAAPPPSGSVGGGDPPNSARIRLANLVQGGPKLDLCAKLGSGGAGWESGKVTSTRSEGVGFGEVSTHSFINAAKDAKDTITTKYTFRPVPVGTSCDADPAPYGETTSKSVGPGAGVTIVAYGKTGGGTGSDSNPKSSAWDDIVNPVPNSAQIRAFHGAPELSPFDLVVDGTTLVQGIRYGGMTSPTSTSGSGFASLPAGIAEGSTITLRAGTTAKNYKATERVRRGLAVTIFVGGPVDSLSVKLCSDRTPESGNLATCTDLQSQ
jgi:hypothetical protein